MLEKTLKSRTSKYNTLIYKWANQDEKITKGLLSMNILNGTAPKDVKNEQLWTDLLDIFTISCRKRFDIKQELYLAIHKIKLFSDF